MRPLIGLDTNHESADDAPKRRAHLHTVTEMDQTCRYHQDIAHELRHITKVVNHMKVWQWAVGVIVAGAIPLVGYWVSYSTAKLAAKPDSSQAEVLKQLGEIRVALERKP
jgi:hypothetical protein